MKIAYVHDWLIYSGGAEKVFFDIIKGDMKNIFDKNKYNIKEEKIFTNFYNQNFQNPTNIEIEYVIGGKHIEKYYRNFMPFFPLITKQLGKKIKKYNPDLVIISSFAIGKNLDINYKKILYLHSSMQYIWSHYEEYVNKFSGIKKIIFKLSANYLRKWDKKYTYFNEINFNSNYTKKLFNEIYKQNSNGNISHPIVEIPNYKKINVFEKYNIKGEYFIYIGRIVKFAKHLDKIIEVYNKTGKQLIIVGDGPDKDYLKKISKKNIMFLGYIDYTNDDYRNLLENAKALINLTKESFGIVNYQAGKIGTKIISINHGAIEDIPGEKIFINNIGDLEKIILTI